MAKIVLITGGARSGKSAFAEKLARQAGALGAADIVRWLRAHGG